MFSHIDFTEFIRQSTDDSLIVSVAAVRCVIVADFDGDDMIDKNDLKKVITRLTGVQVLESIDMDQLINNVRRLFNYDPLSLSDEAQVSSSFSGFVKTMVCFS